MTEDNRRSNAIQERQRGEACLAEARYLLEGGFHNAAVSRAYYAAFHCALALLILKGLEPKTHRGVIQLLQLHYVETGALSAGDAAAIGQLETYRELSDYNAKVSFDATRAVSEVHRAEGFVASCCALIPQLA
jgi:uncharacterized protein (UPF0332 family)